MHSVIYYLPAAVLNPEHKCNDRTADADISTGRLNPHLCRLNRKWAQRSRLDILSGKRMFPVSSAPRLVSSGWLSLDRTGPRFTTLKTEGSSRVQRPRSSQWEPYNSLMRINTLHWGSMRQKISGPMGYELNMTGRETSHPSRITKVFQLRKCAREERIKSQVQGKINQSILSYIIRTS